MRTVAPLAELVPVEDGSDDAEVIEFGPSTATESYAPHRTPPSPARRATIEAAPAFEVVLCSRENLLIRAICSIVTVEPLEVRGLPKRSLDGEGFRHICKSMERNGLGIGVNGAERQASQRERIF